MRSDIKVSSQVSCPSDITYRCNKPFPLTHLTAAQRSPRSSSRRRHKKKSKRKRRERDAEDSVPAAAVEATAPVPAPHVEAAPAKVTPPRQDTPTSSSRDGRSWLSHSQGPARLIRITIRPLKLRGAQILALTCSPGWHCRRHWIRHHSPAGGPYLQPR